MLSIKKTIPAFLLIALCACSITVAAEKVLCFGDSITEGTYIDGNWNRGNSWVNRLNELSGGRIEAINAGLSGRKTSHIEGLNQAIELHAEVDHVMIFLGVNDLRVSTQEVLDACVTNTNVLVKRIREAYPGVQVTLLSSPGLDVPNVTERFRSKGYDAKEHAMLAKLRELYRTFTQQHDCHFIDLWGVVSAGNFSDGLHPGTKGQIQIAERIWRDWKHPKLSTTTAGQLGVPISWIKVPGTADQYYMAQQTGDGQLILTPNESFFPKRGLTATGKSVVPDVDSLNKGNSFEKIERWDAGDIAEWGIFLEQPGQVEIRIWMSNTGNSDKFTLQIDNLEHAFTTKQTGNGSTQVTTALFQITKPGRHSVRLLCNQATGKVGLHQIKITGSAANKASVLRKRWRPAAAHTRFSSSKAAGDIRLWVMEMDAVPGELSFYCPITTPFGYYGPSWQADGKVNTSFNFSLWSFKRGGQEPPVEQLSHLLAVGNPEASFSGFAHEGTGVKIRNWEPLAGRQGQRQTLALRVEPGPLYDTYYSYFYAADEKQWKLFGVGNKFNKQKPLKSLWVGSFVEVPGPAPVQRTGPYERIMRYRGWVMDAAGNWYPLDRMTSGNINRETGLTHTERGVTDDGWFYLQTGGWTFRKMESAEDVELAPKFTKPQVEYLDKDDIAFLTSMPAEITISKVERKENQITGIYTLRGTVKDNEVTLYWGTNEGLTLADLWQNELPLSLTGKFNIKNVPADKTIFLRILLKNSEGKFWTVKTTKVAP